MEELFRNGDTDYDKSRTRDKERDASRSKGGEEDERTRVDRGDTKVVGNKAKQAEADDDDHELLGLRDRNDKPVGQQSTSEVEERIKR